MMSSGILKTDSRYYVIKELEEDTSYMIVVEAVTSKGALGSQPINVTTLEDG